MTEKEDLALEALLEFLNAVEAGIAAAKQLIKEKKGITEKPKWNPDAIKWVEAEGFRGKYQRYPGAEEKAESTSDYRALLEDLKKHDGRLTRGGYFYWLFEDKATVGRKKRG